MKITFRNAALACAGAGAAFTLAQAALIPGGSRATLEPVAQFAHQVTGVTVSERGRIFVNFPRWTEDAPVSVAEVLPGGALRPYPNPEWNAWRNVLRDEVDPGNHWVCVQSVVADGRGGLWVLDPAAPGMDGVVPGGPKLVRIDLRTDQVAQVIHFDQSVAIPGSYLNDLRFSKDGRFVFITDSGQRGALVVLELATGKARRVLDGHPSTQPEPGVAVRTDGRPLRYPDGRKVLFAADSIALSGDGATLYYKALTGNTLYRIPAQVLENQGFAGQDVSASVQPYGQTGPSDGFWIPPGSQTLYVTSPEIDAVTARDLTRGAAAGPSTVVQDPRLRWPDTFSQGPDGAIYVTASHIQDSAFFNRDAPLALPTQLWRLRFTR